MKLRSITAGIMILTLAMFSCKKDDVKPAFNIEGKWSGKHGEVVPDTYYGLVFKSNGVLQRVAASGTVGATGSWTFSGNILTGTYTFDNGTVVSLKATYDPATGKLSGTYGYGSDTSGEAVFYLTRD